MSSIIQPSIINPYDSLSSVFTTGLDTIIAGFSGTPATDELIAAISAYLQSQFYPSGTLPLDQQQQLNAIVGNVFNTYTNSDDQIAKLYTPKQVKVINQFIYDIRNISVNIPNAFYNWSLVTMDYLTWSGLTTTEINEIFIVGSVFGPAWGYFYTEIYVPDSDWAPYLDPDTAVNLNNLASWTIASLRGGLIGGKQSIYVTPTTAQQGTGTPVNMITAIGGGLAATFGEILFNWVERPENPVCK